MDAAKSVTATFTLVEHTLTVTRTGSGSGTVTSSPSGIFCGAVCAADYVDGSLVSLTATPDASSTFAGWSGACTGTGSCTVTMDAAKSVTATFTQTVVVQEDVLLTVAKAGTGVGNVTSDIGLINCGASCAQLYPVGAVVTLTAVPIGGNVFGGWSGACTGTSPTCVVTMSSARAVTATFNAVLFPLNVTRSGTGSGTVTSAPAGIFCGSSCSATFAASTIVTLTPTAAGGSTFAGWSGACTGTGSCTVTMDAAKSVNATFDTGGPIGGGGQATLTSIGIGASVVSAPAGISCTGTCSAPYASGTVVTLTATTIGGTIFTGWDGCDSSSGLTCTVTMTGNRTVIAKAGYNLAVSLAGSGTGTVTSSVPGIFCSPQCIGNYAPGTVVTLTPTPSGGSSFAGWSGACTGTGTCTVTMSSALAVTATFQQPLFSLSVQRGGNPAGLVTSSPGGINCGSTCTASYSGGSTVTLTATGAPVGSWTGCDSFTATTCTVNVTSNRSLNVSFL